ncbi:unnamed protein product [Effrenium voratum]|nr:unnamed protein product [Effrenium voratum]
MRVEDLEHRILAEAAAKEELKCSAEVLAQSLNLALLRLKDACRAEPAGDWLQRQVWQFCDDVQETAAEAQPPQRVGAQPRGAGRLAQHGAPAQGGAQGGDGAAE